jgi:hypothetical protein
VPSGRARKNDDFPAGLDLSEKSTRLSHKRRRYPASANLWRVQVRGDSITAFVHQTIRLASVWAQS